jgi:integrase
MSQLWQHENGTFYILYGERLRRRTSTRTKDRVQAERRLAQWIANEGTQEPDEEFTLARLLHEYEKDAVERVRSKQTLQFAVKALSRHLANLRIRDLTPRVVERYAKDRGIGAAGVLRELSVLRAALSWAVAHKWITQEQKPIISSPVRAPKPRDRWMTKDEAKRLLAATKAPHMKLFIMLGLMTAARMAAILELKWDQVDLERRQIDYGEGHGNKRRAVAPINDQLYRLLSAAKEMSVSDYVVNYHGAKLDTVKKGFKIACDRAGIKGVTPHILRHTAATWMALDGVPLAEIARMLGDEERTVERVYAKHTPAYLARAASALQFDEAAE